VLEGDGGKLRWAGKGWRTFETVGSGWARGYAFIGDGACLEDEEIASYLLKHSSQLEATVAAMNGCFAAAIDAITGPFLITDRYGTIPVYIHRTTQGVHASDVPWEVVETLESPPVLDPNSALDLLRTGYVTGIGTLIQGIDTVAPASIVEIRRDGLRRVRYWEYGYRPEPLTWNEAQERLAEVLRRVAARVVHGLESRGYRGALTLSGGLDSRVLASIFSSASQAPLSAFSYGTRGDPEIDVAKKVASRLGMPHRQALVTSGYFNDDFIDRSVREVGLTTRFTCGIGARHLEASWADVMIPGHTGDFISGGHLPAQAGMVRTGDQLRHYLELTHFRYRGSDRALQQILRIDYPACKWKTLEASTEDFDMSQDTLGLIDRWNVENRQRRMILMELRAYEELGRWMLPFYDNELVDFFASIPHDFRIAQNLYIQTAKRRLFSDGRNGLEGIQRIGGRSMKIDYALPRRLGQLQRLQPFSGWALQFGLAKVRDLGRALRPKPEQVFGTDPLKSWFKNDESMRNYVLGRIESMDVDLLDSKALTTLLLRGSGEERIYTRLLPAALTIQACLDRARDVWSRSRRLSAPQ
jgi:asparagine synthase (glutamine-hydrolysing)